MFKLGRILNSRAIIYGKLANTSNIAVVMLGSDAFMSRAGISTYGQNARQSDRIYVAYTIYKGKASLSAQPVSPNFTQVNTGALRVKRQGYIMLSFCPAVGERKYDWERRQLFALSATEVGSLINLSPNGSCEFFHDPGIKTSNVGQVRKSLSIKAQGEGSGYFVSLSVSNTVTKTNERFTVPVTSAEFAVMRTSFSFALPHIMGWDRYTSQIPTLDGSSANKVGPPTLSSSNKVGPQRSDSEWDR